MRNQRQWLEYKKLELIPLEPAEEKWLRKLEQPSWRDRLTAVVNQIWKPVVRALEVSTEPQVWKTYDENGNPIWHTQDPMTGQLSDWVSEDDVRVWLEQRYNQPGISLWISPVEER